MKISLIMATLGRVTEIKRLLESLERQTYRNFELIIVDQNKDNRLDALVSSFVKKMKIQHIKTGKCGLSFARNHGIQYIQGEIIAFPDDDCWYFPDTLEKVVNKFNDSPSLGCITGCPIDQDGNFLLPSVPKTAVFLDNRRIWHAAISITIFVKTKIVMDQSIRFDENLGVGADSPYGSGEETDFLLILLEKGIKLKYFPDLQVGHPNKEQGKNRRRFKTLYSYGCGLGYVLKKHHAPFMQKLTVLIRPSGGALIALVTGKPYLAVGRIFTFIGRLRGLFS